MASFGEELRRERELRDISLKEISEATKISMRFLEALEQDNFDILPGGIFNRGFIRAYARFIGIDGEEMVNAYLHEVSLRQQNSPGSGSQERMPPRQSRRFSEELYRPDDARAVRSNGDGARPRSSIPAGTRIRNASDSTAGRTSLILWVLVITAFLIGAGVITLSVMREPAEASAAASQIPDPQEPSGPAPDSAAAGPVEAEKEPPPPPKKPQEEARAEPRGSRGGGQRAPGPETSVPPATAAVKPPVSPDPPAAQPVAEVPVAPVDPPPSGGVRHRVTVLATEATHVRIECAGRVALFQELWPGGSRTVQCHEPVRLSADNAGAVRYTVDDGPVTLLGRPGERVHAVTVAPADDRARP